LSLDLVLLTVTFFLSGRLLRSRVKAFTPQGGLVLTAALVFVAIALSTDAAVRLNERLYEPPFLSTVAAFAGIYVILTTARLLERIDTLRRPLCWLGSASIFILIFHYTIEARLYRLLTTQLPILPELLSATLAFAGSIALSLAIRAVIIRSEFLSMLYLPRGAVHFRNLRARLQPLRR
jgi:fucose 4-O-acetylase-like acetyltransferase